MRGFLLGIIVTLIGVFGGAYWFRQHWHFDTRAIPNGPGQFERHTANHSVGRMGGRARCQAGQPVQADCREHHGRLDGVRQECAVCHGSLKQPVSP